MVYDMLDISLIDTGSNRDEFNEPIGIEVLAGCLDQEFKDNVSVKLFTLHGKNINNIPVDILNSNIIGISAQINSANIIKKLLNRIRNQNSKKNTPLVVVGNILATFNSFNLLNFAPDIICITGEGENALRDIVSIYLEDIKISLPDLKLKIINHSVPNIALKTKNKIVYTSKIPVNLEQISYPRRDLLNEVIEKNGIVRIEGSRGCPYNCCSFCSVENKYGYRGWRPFSVAYVHQELIRLSSLGANRPYFTDEDFIGLDPERVLKLANLIISSKKAGEISKKLNFFISTSVKSILNCGDQTRLILSRLQEAGLREIFLGLESGSKEQLKRYNKNFTIAHSKQVVDLLKEMGFVLDLGFIMFDPEMSLEELKENIKFIFDTGINRFNARLTKSLLVLPSTELTNRLISIGIANEALDLSKYSHDYKFIDFNVEMVFKAFNRWENYSLHKIYTLQGVSRGGAIPFEKLKIYRNILSSLRNLDLMFLSLCISTIENNNHISVSKLYNSVVNKLDALEKRNSFLRKYHKIFLAN